MTSTELIIAADLSALKFHPLAELLLPMEGDELRLLAEDIAARGQRHPIILYEGEILDGRARYLACKEIGLEPNSVIYSGNDPIGEVISVNYRRGHKNESQRALAAARLANMPQGARTDLPAIAGRFLSQDQAARLFNVSIDSLERAKAILPFLDLADAVGRGDLRKNRHGLWHSSQLRRRRERLSTIVIAP